MSILQSIAAVQTVPVRGDVAVNVEQHRHLVRIAAEHGAEVLVFPELSLTGYEMELASELAFADGDPRLSPLMEAAAATMTTLIVGAPIRIESRLHIGAFILYPDGTHLIHTKRHLGAFSPDVNPNGTIPPAESTVFDPGTLCPLVRCGEYRATVGICAEALQPAATKDAAERGAKTYLTSHFGVPSDLAFRHRALGTYAAHYGMAVVFANYGGPTGGLSASGGSAIFSPDGELLARLGPSGPGVAVAIEDATGFRGRAAGLDGLPRGPID